MQLSRVPVYVLIILAVFLAVLGSDSSAQTTTPRHGVVIAASTVLDGKGHTLHDVRIVVEGSKIVAIDHATQGPVDYDLRGLTVLPGWIDAHVHITWIFGKDGKKAGTDGTTQEDAYKAASNAWLTLMAGFTTVQSVGAPNDVALRDAIAKGNITRATHPYCCRTAGRTRRGDRYTRTNPGICQKAKSSRRGPDQNLRLRIHSEGRRNDSVAGTAECGL